MRGKLLRTFIEVAECKSFSKAEKNLFLSKQAIVKQIDNLEKELGFDLFYRTSRGVTLTPAGTVYQEGVKKILSYSEQLLEDCLHVALSKQVLRIENQKHPRFLLQGAIDAMRLSYPNLRMDITMSPDPLSGERILSGVIDIAEVPGCKDVLQPGITYTKLIDFPYKCLVHETHPLAGKAFLLPEDLSDTTIIVNNPKFRHHMIDYLQKRANHVTFEKGTGDEMEQVYTTCYNNGIYLSTAFYLNHLPNLKAIPIQCDLTQEYGIIYRSESSYEVQLFISAAQKYCKSII